MLRVVKSPQTVTRNWAASCTRESRPVKYIDKTSQFDSKLTPGPRSLELSVLRRGRDAVTLIEPGVHRIGKDGLEMGAAGEALGDPSDSLDLDRASQGPVSPRPERGEVADGSLDALVRELPVVAARAGPVRQLVAFGAELTAFIDRRGRRVLGEVELLLGGVDAGGGALVVASGAASVQSTG